jgi:hypothetical protein
MNIFFKATIINNALVQNFEEIRLRIGTSGGLL